MTTLPIETEPFGTFKLTDDEIRMAEEWMANQRAVVLPLRPIAADFLFTFLPSQIGTAAYITDRRTGDRLDLTKDVEW